VTDVAELQKRARKRYKQIARRRADPRYRRVLGRYVAAKLLVTNEEIQPYRAPIEVRDALWAGEVEPRILELLPALIIKRPSLFTDPTDLPDDLREVVEQLRRDRTPAAFRGIEGNAIRRWLPSVGHQGKLPSQLKSFRLQVDDVRLLERLSSELGISQTAAIRRGLRLLAAQSLAQTPDTQVSPPPPARPPPRTRAPTGSGRRDRR
jgi:hypothetical protein